MSQPDLSRISPFFHRYISYVTEENLSSALDSHVKDPVAFLERIPETKWEYRYAEGKWSVKELVQHMIDTERIFCYRALRFARKDSTPLSGFDEVAYGLASNADKRTKDDLISELRTVLLSSAQMFRSFDEEQLEQEGFASGNPMYVKGLGFTMVGHARHHLAILK